MNTTAKTPTEGGAMSLERELDTFRRELPRPAARPGEPREIHLDPRRIACTASIPLSMTHWRLGTISSSLSRFWSKKSPNTNDPATSPGT